MSKLYLAIGIGGMVGAVCRYAISLFLQDSNSFPLATLTVNLVGCFFLSFLMNHPIVKRKFPPQIFSALTVGVIGSFTTYSTFAIEIIELWDRSIITAFFYLISSVIGGLVSCFVGYKVATRKQVRL